MFLACPWGCGHNSWWKDWLTYIYRMSWCIYRISWPQAANNLCSGTWSHPLLLFLHWRWCLQGCFLYLFSQSMLLCSFLPSYTPFPRSTTRTADGFGCVLQQLCTAGGGQWLCPAWGSPGLCPHKPCSPRPALGHGNPALFTVVISHLLIDYPLTSTLSA